MQSFLIVGGTAQTREERALEFGKTYKVSRFDTLMIEPGEAGSIGIEKIRELKTKLALKPFNSSYKLAIFLGVEKATVEAQNAFLKTLEEPPRQTLLVLTAPNADLLLPTLVSRCQVIQLATSYQPLATGEFSIFNFQFSILLEGGVGERLKLAQEISHNPKEILPWLEKMIILGREELLGAVFKKGNNRLTQYLNFLISFQKIHTLLSTTNVNPRFTLETYFLNKTRVETKVRIC